MSLETPRVRVRWPVIRWFVGILLLAGAIGATVPLSRPTVLVGRTWLAADRLASAEVSHAAWDELLRRYVDAEGNVDYAGWKDSVSDMRRLDKYLEELARLDTRREATASERLTFWINAYNAVTVRGILREYPTSSIQNHVGRVWGYNIWRDLRLIVGDQPHSLGEIEHDLLRPLLEPRVHFAIVCASRGCPRLRNEAYLAERLDEQLAQNAADFFADSTKCVVDLERRELRLSPIMNWYAADFGATQTERLRRIVPWLPQPARELALSGDVRLTFLEYDWSLNDQTTSAPPLPPLP